MSDHLTPVRSLGPVRRRDETIGRQQNETLSVGDFAAKTDDWRARLNDHAGRNFALYFEDGIEFAAALIGAWQANKRCFLPGNALAATCRSLAESVDGFIGDFPPNCSPITPTRNPSCGRSFAGSDVDFAVPASSELVIYTSGSTGQSKAIFKRLDQLTIEAEALESLFGAKLEGVTVLTTVSHQHIYGLLFNVVWPLLAGRLLPLGPLRFPEEICAVSTATPTALISSPALLKRLPDSPAWTAASHRLTAVFSSGGPLDANAARQMCESTGQAPIEIYGSSETGGIAWRQRTTTQEPPWRPMPGVDWRIDEDQQQLEISSPYLADRSWLRLADRAKLSDDDGFALLGRADRIVKIEEKRVSLDAIERTLQNSSLVSEARVFSVDLPERTRQVVAAFVVLTPQGRDLLASDGPLIVNRLLKATLVEVIEPVAIPRRWRYLDHMPVNAQGKISYAELTAQFDNPSDTDNPFPTQPVVRMIDRSSTQVALALFIPKRLYYFDGHFPDRPVLPGVVQLDWAIVHGRRCFDLPPDFIGIQALKFQKIIPPDVEVQLKITHVPDKNRLDFRYVSGDLVYSTGRVLFADGPESHEQSTRIDA